MKDRKKKLVVASAMFISLMMVVIIYFSVGELTLPREDDYSGQNMFELKGWKQVMSGGIAQDIKLPQKLTGEKGMVEITAVLPKINTSGMWIMFWNQSRDVDVYINDELRYSYDTNDSKFFGRYSPFSNLFIELRTKDSGAVITIKAHESYSEMFDEVYVGDRLSLYKKAMSPYLLELLFALFLMGVGATCIIVLSIVEIILKESVPMTHLSWAIFAVSMWIMVNDGARQFFFPNVSVVRDVAYMCVCVMPLPFLMYCDEIQKYKYHNHYTILEILGFVDAVMIMSMYAFNMLDWIESFKTVEIIIFLDIAYVVYTLMRDIISRRIREYKMSALTILVLAVAIGTQITLFITLPSLIYNGIIMEIGMFVALVLSIVNTVINLSKVQLEKTRAVMESEEKAKFLANMSHEIRTPINAVLGMNELIIREAKDGTILEYARNIESSGNMLLSLVNDILDFSKIEAGRMQIVPVEYMVSSMLNDAISLIRNRATKKGLQLEVKVNPDTPQYLLGDELRIRQILINLLTNAVKYTEKGSITINVDYRYAENQDFILCMSVKDTGIGIKEEDQLALFDSFKRVDELKNRSVEGTGLGLSITKRILDYMDGEIHVSSTYGKGSEFKVEIPQKVLNQVVIGTFEIKTPSEIEGGYRESFHAPTARVLVVDDNNMNIAVFKGLLKNTKVQIDMASSGKECIDKVITNNYDVIYLDHMMPEMDGVETLARLRQLGLAVGVPIIALTANAIQGAKEMYLENGFTDYLSKPIEGKDLEENILRWIPSIKIEQVEKRIEDILDTKIGLSHCGDSEEFYKEMIAMYIDADKAQSAEAYFNQEDWENYRITMHSIKSTSLTIGAVEMSEAAKEMEMATKNMNLKYVKENHNRILKIYRRLLNDLKKI